MEHIFTITDRDGKTQTIAVEEKNRREAFSNLYTYCLTTPKGIKLADTAIKII